MLLLCIHYVDIENNNMQAGEEVLNEHMFSSLNQVLYQLPVL